MQSREGSPHNSTKNIQKAVVSVLAGGAAALVLTCLVLFLCSVLISLGVLPEGLMKGFVIAICGVSMLLCGRSTVKRSGWNPLLTGLCCGAVFCVLLMGMGLLLYREMSLSGNTLLVMLSAMSGGALAGAGGGFGKKKKKSRKRK